MNAPSPELPGMPCPQCGMRLVVSMEQILGSGEIRCGCGLVLQVDAARSAETLRGLRELQRRLAEIKGQG